MPTHNAIIEILVRTPDLERELERAAAYLYRGWEFGDVVSDGEPDGYCSVEVVADDYPATSAGYLCDRLLSGMFGAKVVQEHIA